MVERRRDVPTDKSSALSQAVLKGEYPANTTVEIKAFLIIIDLRHVV
jgi:hypothetical protein